jgi:hypothetical protein
LKRSGQSDRSSRSYQATTVGAVAVIVFAMRSFGSPDWSRDVEYSVDDTKTSFAILSTSSTHGQLSAHCAYHYLNEKGPVVLRGTIDSDRRFWPFVSYEVETPDKKKWRPIGKSTETKNPVTVQFDSDNQKDLFLVDMEPFRSVIGKFRRGRLVLANGETSEFMIDDLLPTGGSVDVDGNFRQDITDPNPKRFGSIFSLVSVTSLSNRLVGDFIFCGAQGTFTEVKGAKTIDGYFWPFVTFQGGNTDYDWQTLGKAAIPGTPSSLRSTGRGPWKPLRVPLDVYKTRQGQFKYGKLIFADGDIAVFQIADLKPK